LQKAAKGTSVLAVQSGVNALLGTFLFMYMARVLSKAEMGVYGTATLIFMVTSIMGRLGLNTAASRFISHLYGNNKAEMAGAVSKRILYLSVVSASVVSIILFVISPVLSNLLLGDYQHTQLFQTVSFALFSAVLGFVFSGFIQGLQMFTRLALALLLSQVIRVAVAATLLTRLLGVESLFFGYVAYYVLLVALSLGPALNLFKRSNSASDQSVMPLLSFSLPMVGYELANYLYNSLDQYIVLNITGIETLGTYTVAITAASLTMIVGGIPLSTTLTPGFSEFYGRSDAMGVTDSIKPTSRYVSLLFIPATLGLAALSPVAINILAGQQYLESWLPTTVMCLGIATYGFSAIITSALIALGKTGSVMKITLIASAVGLALTIALTNTFGIVGAASAKALMYGLLLALSLYFGAKFLPLSFDNKAISGSIAASTVMAITVYSTAYYTGFNLILLPIYIVVGLLIYALILSTMRILTLQDVRFISQIMPGGKPVYDKLYQVVKNTESLSKIAQRILRG